MANDPNQECRRRLNPVRATLGLQNPRLHQVRDDNGKLKLGILMVRPLLRHVCGICPADPHTPILSPTGWVYTHQPCSHCLHMWVSSLLGSRVAYSALRVRCACATRPSRRSPWSCLAGLPRTKCTRPGLECWTYFTSLNSPTARGRSRFDTCGPTKCGDCNPHLLPDVMQ